MLTKQVLYALAIPQVHFALIIFEMGSYKLFAPRLALNHNPSDLKSPK
jgi:hypothetical protein